MAVLLFCQCGSDRVDIKLWNVRRAQLHCLTCGQEAWLEGFTVSEFDPAKLLTAAVIDQARKHRRRPQDEVRRIEEHRKRQTRQMIPPGQRTCDALRDARRPHPDDFARRSGMVNIDGLVRAEWAHAFYTGRPESDSCVVQILDRQAGPNRRK